MRVLTYCYVFALIITASAYCENFVLENLTLTRDLPWYQVANRFKSGEFFSGFLQTTKVEFDYSSAYNLFDYTEVQCSMDFSDDPITGRFFAASNETDDSYFYYCPKNKSILVLGGDYLQPESSIEIYDELPQFNWTKFYTNGTYNGIVYILGVVFESMNSAENNVGFNFTESYIVVFNGNTKKIESYTKIYAADGGTFTSIAIVGNTVYGIAENVYEYDKTMALYSGTLGVEEFSTKLDTWYSDQNAIFPDIQTNYDRTWVIYSTNTTVNAIYLASPSQIFTTPAASTTYAFNNVGSTLSIYIPLFFKASNLSNSVFVYVGPNVTQYYLSTTKGFELDKSYFASTGANDYDQFARRMYYFVSNTSQEWIYVSAGERAPSTNIINFSEGGLVQAIPSLEANATLWANKTNYFYIAKNGIYTLQSNWHLLGFQYLANFGKVQDSTTPSVFSMMGGIGGQCILTQWNSTSNNTAQFLFPQNACIPSKQYNTSYNPQFPNVVEMFVGPLFRPIVGTRIKSSSLDEIVE